MLFVVSRNFIVAPVPDSVVSLKDFTFSSGYAAPIYMLLWCVADRQASFCTVFDGSFFDCASLWLQ